MIDIPITPDLVRGALELERTDHGLLPHRLPARARAQFPDAYLASVEAQPSGVRLAFRTRATVIELDVLPTKVIHPGFPEPEDGVYDLLVDGHLTGRSTATVTGTGTGRPVRERTARFTGAPTPERTTRFTGLPDREKDVEIWLPLREITELVALRADAPLTATSGGGRRVWLHHGSSISHGSAADGPSTTWPALAATRAGVELINLGLGGNALLDPFTARAMRETPADLVSVKIGINLVNHDLMRLRAFGPAVHGFLDTIREGHPGTPLLVVSPILCPFLEDTPGPIAPHFDGGRLTFRSVAVPQDGEDGRLTLTVIRDELTRLIAHRDDPNLHYLDGRALYGEADYAELPLPDELHPDPAGHRRIGERFAALAFGGHGPFTGTGDRKGAVDRDRALGR
ncbi:SGNH/GDSL hydrolase family protein [Streptosporangium oxazolinicum]|uniref:SGNH/GDSL hydrolase family protein n=1 Tax=Streptosporangium oxazolinicum TaxID=909287 RepID=A0ABP8ATZ6_9ACTN